MRKLSTETDFSAETKNLEIMSWWVSASEYPALDVLLNAFREAHPGVIVEGGTISGGGGSNVIVALAQRLQDGNPPDVWQTFVGSPARAYAAEDTPPTSVRSRAPASFRR